MTTDQQETADPQQGNDPIRPNVRTFKISSFQLSQFEVLSERTSAGDFTSTEWVCVEKAVRESDPMFEVFDGGVVNQTEPAESVEMSTEVEGEAVEDGAVEERSEEDSSEEAPITSEEVRELQEALVKAQEERQALEEAHAQQLEELRAQVAEEARQEAEKQSDERLKAIEERYASLIEDLNTQIQEGIEGVERRAVEFAVRVAKKLVGTTVEVNPEYILGIIKEATKLTGGATIKSIRVSPQDLEFLKMLSPDKQFKEFDGSWSFQADETIHAGCVVETSSGEVEFDLDKAWERIKESVIKVR